MTLLPVVARKNDSRDSVKKSLAGKGNLSPLTIGDTTWT